MSEPQVLTSSKRFLNRSDIAECVTFRDAVRLAWKNRARQNMTQSSFAEELGAHPSHVSRWLDGNAFDKHGQRRPDLPAELIPKAEQLLGNHALSQYLTRLGMLTLMEEVIQQRNA